MSRLLKILLWLVGGTVLLVVLAAIIVPLVVDPNDFRDRIGGAVTEQTGRSLQIEGDIKLRVFPWLALRLGRTTLGNAEGFGPEPFASVEEADVSVRLWPLLRDREVHVGTVTLKGLSVNLARDAQGRDNWSDLAKPKEDEPAAPDDEAGVEIGTFDVGAVKIADAALVFDDRAAGKRYAVDKLNLDTGKLTPGEPVDLKLGFTVNSSQPQATATVELTGRITADLDNKVYTIEGLKLGGNVSATEPAVFADIDFSGRVQADAGKQVYTVDGLALEVEASGGAVPGGKQTVKLVAPNVRYSGDGGGQLALPQAKLQAAGLDIDLQLEGSGLTGGQPKLGGSIKAPNYSPRALAQALGVELPAMQDARALTAGSLSARYDGTFSSAKLSDLQLNVDDTHVTGTFSVRDFATQALEFALQVDTLDLDRYMAPPAAEPAPAAGAPARADDINAIRLPTEVLEQLNAVGTVQIASLKVQGVKLTDVKLDVNAPRNGQKKQTVTAQLYGGGLKSESAMQPGNPPTWATQLSLLGVNAGPLLTDLLGKEPMIGRGSFQMNLAGTGNTVGDLRRALDGTMGFDFRDGAIKGVNIAQALRTAQAAFKGQPAAQANEPAQTDFASLVATATIVDGVLQSRDLDGRNPLLRLGGQGMVDLVNERIDYTVMPTVVQASTGQGGAGLEELAGIMIPVRFSGDLFHPKMELDIRTALQQKATEAIRAELDGKKDELQDKARERIGDALQNLFGGNRRNRGAAPAQPGTQPPPAPAPAPAPATPPPG